MALLAQTFDLWSAHRVSPFSLRLIASCNARSRAITSLSCAKWGSKRGAASGTRGLRQLQQLIEQTGTDIERVLAYYKISALTEMTEASYRCALELLNRKLGEQNHEAVTSSTRGCSASPATRTSSHSGLPLLNSVSGSPPAWVLPSITVVVALLVDIDILGFSPQGRDGPYREKTTLLVMDRGSVKLPLKRIRGGTLAVTGWEDAPKAAPLELPRPG